MRAGAHGRVSRPWKADRVEIRNRPPRASGRTRLAALALLALAALAGAVGGTRAQAPEHEPLRGPASFRMDLDEVGRILDRLFPSRHAVAVWDTLRAFDWDHVVLGNQHHRVPHFLHTDAGRMREVVDDLALPGHRLVLRAPRTWPLRPVRRAEGDLQVYVPRDFSSIDSLRVTIEPLDAVVERIRRRSLRETWRETIVASITARQLSRGIAGQRGIRIAIPVPMPRQLESIFGPSEKTHINISGRESITLSGETRRVDPFIGVEGRERQSLFPSLDMKQELDVSLTGTIGDKVNIQIDHSSQAVGDQANRIRVNYKGYDDDVIQLVELGSTSLSLPGSQLVSFSTQSKGLFGIKVLAKLGATDMTFIASKQEGQTSSASFSPTGGAIGSAEVRVIRDVDYVRRKYFYFDHPLVFVGVDEREPIDVYVTVTPSEIQIDPEINRLPGYAFVDHDGFGEDIDAAVVALKVGAGIPPNIQNDFRLLEPERDYRFAVDQDNNFVGIELVQPLTDPNKSLAVSYTNRRHKRIGGSFSELGIPISPDPAQRDTLVLELLWPRDTEARPDSRDFGWLWGYQMRHIYNLGLSNIDPNTFSLEIQDLLNPRLDQTRPEGANVPYIRIFGLDRTDVSGTGPPDGRVDLDGTLIDFNLGILAFPTSIRAFVDDSTGAGDSLAARAEVARLEAIGQRTPFTGFAPDTSLVAQWTDSLFQFNGRYLDQYVKARRIYEDFLNENDELDVNQYVIRVEAVSTSRTFSLDAFNIIENSEVITIDGQRLQRGTDYDIDYATGEITLKGGALDRLTPDSRISVDYEFKPFGGVSSSSLLGFNAISRLGKARLGTTWLYESKAAPSGRPQIGEEPTRTFVGSVNASLQHQSERLTRLVNLLPLVDTDAPSTVNFNGEVALSVPDPNTRGEASLDDFEGSEDSDNITLARRIWYPASPPRVPTSDGIGIALPDTARLGFVWYNIEPRLGATRRDLNPLLDEREDATVQTLDFDLDAIPSPTDTTSWVGVMTGFRGGGLDLTQGQFLEIWVNDFTQDPARRGGVLHIDMGTIDEDFFEPERNRFDDEDRDRDGFAAAFDDTGLDGLFDEDEPGYDPDRNPDPNGDDIDLSRIQGRFSRVNGTEGNRVYDTEDLDGNTQLDQVNAYFSFEIHLDDSAEVDIAREFPGYDGFNKAFHQHDAWRKYRVKLSDAKIVAPDGIEPRWDQIRHVRIWFDHAHEVLPDSNVIADIGRRIQIAGLKVQGNRWVADGIRDLDDAVVDTLAVATEFNLGTISTKTDPGVYEPPFRPREDATGIADKEASLEVVYDSLAAQNQLRIRKQFAGRGLDLSTYRELHFWVNTDSIRPGVEAYLRLGTNENNYYEIALPLTSAYFARQPGWHRVSVLLSDLTALKFVPADSLGRITGIARNVVDDRFAYPVRMRGLPSLFTVRFLYAGVRNTRAPTTAPVSGRIWLDDIYVGDVRRDTDLAERADFSLNLGGGVMTLNGSWSRTGPDFRGLRQRRGTGSTSQTVNLSARTNLKHIVPLGGFSVPLTVSYSRSTARPKYMPNSDTELTERLLQDSLQTTRQSRSISTSLQKRGSKFFLYRYTIDRMTTNFSFSRTELVSPARRDTSTSMSGTLNYQMSWPRGFEAKLPVLGWKVRWWLNSINFRTSATRRTSRTWRFVDDAFRREPFLFRASLQNSGSFNWQPTRALSATFSATQDRDPGRDHTWLGINVGPEVRRTHQARVGWKPTLRLLRSIQPDFNVSTGYTENASPTVRRPGDPAGVRNVSSSRLDQAKVRLDVGGWARKFFDLVSFDVGADENTGRRPPPRVPRRPGQGVRPPAGRAASDTSSAESDTTSSRRADPLTALRFVGRVITRVQPVNVSVSRRLSNNYTRIPDRPSLKYQFGLDRDSGVRGYADPERVTRVVNLSADSGVRLSDDIGVQARYSRSISDAEFRGNETRSNNVTWPDVQVRMSGIERVGLLSRYVSRAQANFQYKKSHQENGQKGDVPTAVRDNLNLTPSLVLTWKNDVASNITVTYQKNTSDTRGSKSETSNFRATVDLRKQFQGGSGFRLPIPFLRKQIRWSGRLDANLQLAYSRTGGRRFVAGTDFSEPIPKSTSLRVSPTVTYSFTQALTGRAFIDFGRQFNEATNQTTTTVRVGVNAIFQF